MYDNQIRSEVCSLRLMQDKYSMQVGMIVWSEPPLPWLQWQVLGGLVYHPPFLSSSNVARRACGAAQSSYVFSDLLDERNISDADTAMDIIIDMCINII